MYGAAHIKSEWADVGASKKQRRTRKGTLRSTVMALDMNIDIPLQVVHAKVYI